MTNPQLIYKVMSADAFAASQREGHVIGMPIDVADGYIHLSSAAQLAQTLALHFRGEAGLVLLAVRSAELGDSLKWEPSRGGALFPHVYGALPLSALAWSAPIAVAADGSCALPEAVR